MTAQSPVPRRWSARNVTAVLGPTNTGKTHLAIERMLGHESGIIGLPLRLLAREVYGRIATRIGADRVALVTGEEKVVPPEPRYWVSTVEAMPRETDAAFVAIDEIQLAADLERGHVFTDRLLNLRGTQETLLLGAATMRGIVERLLPGIHVVTRPRMSVLAYGGQKKLTRLPERSAVVTFSADEVYGIGELIRRQRGGAAVVLGALSPRTRNKQVEIYQSGDVDFIVATDAIGMGLNLDVDHVAFAANRKFDGYQHRPLTAAELGQVAGRAGRHMRDGTFGVTGGVDPFEDGLVEAIENHRFEPVRVLQWRNGALDFAAIGALKASLDLLPDHDGLTRAPTADDQAALGAVTGDPEVVDRVSCRADVRRLWDICRIPDYRKIAPAQHAQLVRQLANFLIGGGTIPDEWIGQEVRRASHTDGDIDALSHRIAQVRTWTFVANQPDWVADPAHWQGETRSVEDALSDALHDRLTKRFVDRRTSVLMRRLRENTVPEAEIARTGDVLVEGQHVGTLSGFRFTPDPGADGTDARAVRNAAQQALASAIAERAALIITAPGADIVLSADGHLRWRGEAVARLAPGDRLLKPRPILLADEQLGGPARDQVEARLAAWIGDHVGTLLKPLVDLESDASLAGAARGLAFRLVENLGILDRRDVLQEVRGLEQEARAGLRRHGVRFGAYHIFVPLLLKPGPSGLLALLWALDKADLDLPGLAELQAVSVSGRTSVDVDPTFAPELYRRYGFRVFGRRAVRIDILERLADLIRPAIDWRPPAEPSLAPGEATVPKDIGPTDAAAGGEGTDAGPEGPSDGSDGEANADRGAPRQTARPDSRPRPDGAIDDGRGFTVTPAMTSLLGASGDDFSTILKGLGYRDERQPRAADDPPGAGDGASAGPPAADVTLHDPAAPPANGPTTRLPADGLSATERPADVEATTSDAAAADGAEGPGFIEIWRPARRNRRPHRRPDGAQADEDKGSGRSRSGVRPPRRGAGPGAGGARVKRHERDQNRKGHDRPPPKERPVDPDSPFAALAALKKELEKTGRQ